MSPKKVWTEIDTLRGFAVVFMILNHAGVGWLDLRVDNGFVADSLVLLGSYAPVLFFFVTGIGYGVSHDPTRGRRRGVDVVYKAALLLVADAFWRGGGFLSPGLDFLGFIGLSMGVLHFGCSGRHGRALAWGILLATVGVRFGLGPVLRGAAPAGAWIQSLVGNEPMPGFSYWLTPWLAFPALGFLFGDAIHRLDVAKQLGRLVPALASLGGAAGLVVLVLSRADLVFQRFGTMSFPFFVSTVAVLAFSAALAWLLCAPERSFAPGAALALRGVSSLVVVPIHMFLIVAVGHTVALPLTGGVYLLAMLPFIALNYGLARRADRAAQRLGARTPVGGGAWIAVAALLVAAALGVTVLAPGFARITLATLAQLLVAVLLTVRPRAAVTA